MAVSGELQIQHNIGAGQTDGAGHLVRFPAHGQRGSSYGVPAGAESGVPWTFEKFVVGRSGEVIARFSPDIVPEDPRLLATVDAALAN